MAYEEVLVFVKDIVSAGETLTEAFGATSKDDLCCIMALLLTRAGRERCVKVGGEDHLLTDYTGYDVTRRNVIAFGATYTSIAQH